MFLRLMTLCALLITSLTSCYPMPTEDDYSVIPLTNCRDHQREAPNPLAPGATY